MNELKGKKKLQFKFEIYGHFVQLLERDSNGKEKETSHLMFGMKPEITKIDLTDWTDWLSHWGKNVELIEISKEIKPYLDEMKEKWHKLDYSDVIHKLMDVSGIFSAIPDTPVGKEFVRSMLGEGELKPKIDNMVSKAERYIIICGWMDTTYLKELKRISKNLKFLGN